MIHTSEVPPAMVSARDMAGRITAARERRGLSKAELARQIGKPGPSGWRLVQKWETGENRPDRESFAALVRVLAVTPDELMGTALGQDPPFAAWKDFLATPEGQSMDEGERRALQALAWPSGREPTVAGYIMLLAAIRGGSRVRA